MDTETTGLGWYDEPFAATVAWRSGGSVQSYYFELADNTAWGYLREILSRSGQFVFHNAKFDIQKLILDGVISRNDFYPERLHDTECLSHLIDEHQNKKLKVLARDLLGLETNEDKRVAKARRKLKLKKSDGYHLLPREVIVPYALKDAEFTLLLFEELYPRLETSDLYRKEMELVLVCLDMEAAGIGLDLPYLNKTTRSTNTEFLRAQRAIQSLTGLEVWYPEKQGQKTPEGKLNPNSWQQLVACLNDRGLNVDNTRNETLKPINDDLVRAILDLRDKKKLKEYLDAIERERLEALIHPNFRIFKPVTGRMASGEAEE